MKCTCLGVWGRAPTSSIGEKAKGYPDALLANYTLYIKNVSCAKYIDFFIIKYYFDVKHICNCKWIKMINWIIVNKVDIVYKEKVTSRTVWICAQYHYPFSFGVIIPRAPCGLMALWNPSMYPNTDSWSFCREWDVLRLISSFLRYLKKNLQQELSKRYPFLENDCTTWMKCKCSIFRFSVRIKHEIEWCVSFFVGFFELSRDQINIWLSWDMPGDDFEGIKINDNAEIVPLPGVLI